MLYAFDTSTAGVEKKKEEEKEKAMLKFCFLRIQLLNHCLSNYEKIISELETCTIFEAVGDPHSNLMAIFSELKGSYIWSKIKYWTKIFKTKGRVLGLSLIPTL